jgi:hypothetical protein
MYSVILVQLTVLPDVDIGDFWTTFPNSHWRIIILLILSDKFLHFRESRLGSTADQRNPVDSVYLSLGSWCFLVPQ